MEPYSLRSVGKRSRPKPNSRKCVSNQDAGRWRGGGREEEVRLLLASWSLSLSQQSRPSPPFLINGVGGEELIVMMHHQHHFTFCELLLALELKTKIEPSCKPLKKRKKERVPFIPSLSPPSPAFSHVTHLFGLVDCRHHPWC